MKKCKRFLSLFLSVCLVLCAFPLGAFAATTPVISSVWVGDATSRTALATASGNSYSAAISADIAEEDVRIYVLLLNGVGDIYHYNNGDSTGETITDTNGEFVLIPTAEERSARKVSFSLFDSDSILVGNYTVSWTYVSADTDCTVATFILDGQYGDTEINNDTITVRVPYGYTPVVPAITTNSAKATFSFSGSGENSTKAYAGDGNTLKVTAESGTSRTYTVAVVVLSGFSSFSVEGQCEAAAIDASSNTVTLFLPYGTEPNATTGNYEFSPVFMTDGPSTLVQYTANGDENPRTLISGSQLSLTPSEAENGKEIILKYPNGAVETWKLYYHVNLDPVAAITGLAVGSFSGAVEDAALSLSLPSALRTTTAQVDFEGSVGTMIEVEGQDLLILGSDVTKNHLVLDLTKDSYTLHVTAAGPGAGGEYATKDYTLMVGTDNTDYSQIRSMALEDTDGKQYNGAINGSAGTISFTIPFSNSEPADLTDWKLYWSIGNGSTFQYDSDGDEAGDTAVSNSGATLIGTEAFLPEMFDGQTKGANMIVTSFFGTTSTYNLVITRAAPPKAVVTAAPTAKTGLVFTDAAQELVTVGTAEGGVMQYSLDGETYSADIPTAINAGTYTVYYKVVGDEDHSDTYPATLEVAIAKAGSVMINPVASTNLTYSGDAQALIFAGATDSGIIQYSLDGETYSANIPTATNVGTYTVYYKLVGDENHNDIDPAALMVTIAKAPASLTVPTPAAVTYGTKLSEISLGDGWAWADGETVPTVSNSGYSALYTVSDYTNYDWSSVEGYDSETHTVTRTVAVTVTKADSTVTTAPAAKADLVYTGETKELVSAGTAEGGTMRYSLDGETYSADIPTAADAGTYTVSYKIVGDENHKDTDPATLEVTIGKASVTLTVPMPAAVSYGIKLSEISLGDGWAWADGEIVPAVGNSNYSAVYTVEDDTNFDWSNIEGYDSESHTVTRTVAVTVTKADPVVTTAPAAREDLVYTGEAQELITAGSVIGGKLLYSLDNDSYSSAIPKGTDAGEYLVYCQIVGEENYNNIQLQTLRVTIQPLPVASPEISIDYLQEKLTGFLDGSVYEINGSAAAPENGVVTVTEYIGSTVSIVRKAEGPNSADSAPQVLTIPSRPAAPTSVTAQPVSRAGAEDGRLTGLTEGMEYSEDGDVWITCEGPEITDLSAGSYLVRWKATDSAFTGETAVVEVKTRSSGSPTPPQEDDTKPGAGSGEPVVTIGIAPDGTVTVTVTWTNGQTSVQVTTPAGEKEIKVSNSGGKVMVDISLPTQPAPAKSFQDVKQDSWYKGSVDAATGYGLFNGTSETTFEPNAPMTRGMLATTLHNLSGNPDYGVGENVFSDVDPKRYYADAVDWAAALGVTSGTGSGYSPNDNITREQLVTMLYRYAGTIGKGSDNRDSLAAFSDKGRVSNYAQDAMQWAVAEGLIVGRSNGIAPQGTATRAEVAAVLTRFTEYLKK